MLLELWYFEVGVLADLLITQYLVMVQQKRSLVAGLFSVLITVVNVVVLQNLILTSDFFVHVIAYALGCGVATAVVTEVSKAQRI